jgi:arsenate reductase
MSEALFTWAAEGRHEARSAGTEPIQRILPDVIEAMGEFAMDLRDRIPRRLEAADIEWAEVVVTMGCGEECPRIPGRRYIDWDLPNPKDQEPAEVRNTRDQIARMTMSLVKELDGDED